MEQQSPEFGRNEPSYLEVADRLPSQSQGNELHANECYRKNTAKDILPQIVLSHYGLTSRCSEKT